MEVTILSDLPEVKEVSSNHLGRIYYVLDFLKKAKIAETVNTCVPENSYNVYVEGKGFVCFTLGQVFEIIIINRMYGLKTPIYHIGEWCENTAIPEIYGIPSVLLNDDRIGRLLDKIFPYLTTIDNKITVNIIREFGIEVSQIHFDPSSFKVYGEYIRTSGESPPPINITYGRNGQGKRDDKLVRFGIAITEDTDFPLMAKGYSGNTNDSEMHPEFITGLRKTLKTKDFLFIANTKFDTKENIIDIIDNKGFFLCPGVLASDVKKNFIEKYGKRDKFKPIEYLSKTEKKKPKNKRNYFQAFERMHKIVAKERGKKKRTYQHRLIFVYSPTKAKSEAKSRQKGIAKVQKELNYLASRLHTNRKGYKTRNQVMEKFAAITKRSSCKSRN